MPYPTHIDDLRRRRLLVVGAAFALLVIACITYAVLAHRATSSTPGYHDPTGPGPGPGPDPDAAASGARPTTSRLVSLPPTDDPETFARAVAEALFEWDTATLVGRSDHIEQLVDVADPTGESTPGLLSDLDNYLPTPDAWTELARYQTRQRLSIDSVTTPTTWADAQEQAGNQLAPGTTAFTVHGTRHRTGVWEGEQVTSEHDVAFTVFLVCGPSYPECHLLRLSLPDKPLG